MLKKLVTISLTLYLAVAGFAPAKAIVDVPSSHWAYGAVMDLKSKGVLKGDTQGKFRGSYAVSRYEFAVTMQRLLKHINSSVAAVTEADVDEIISILEIMQTDITKLDKEARSSSAIIEELELENGQLTTDNQELQKQLAALALAFNTHLKEFETLKANQFKLPKPEKTKEQKHSSKTHKKRCGFLWFGCKHKHAKAESHQEALDTVKAKYDNAQAEMAKAHQETMSDISDAKAILDVDDSQIDKAENFDYYLGEEGLMSGSSSDEDAAILQDTEALIQELESSLE